MSRKPIYNPAYRGVRITFGFTNLNYDYKPTFKFFDGPLLVNIQMCRCYLFISGKLC